MDKALPDKWIRKAVYDLIDGITVNSETVECFDTRVTGPTEPDFYVIMSSQTSEVNKIDKCQHIWDSVILLDIRAVYQRAGNTGSRVQVDDMTNAIRDLIKDIDLDAGSGLTVVNRIFSFPNDIVEVDDSEIAYRKFISMNLWIE